MSIQEQAHLNKSHEKLLKMDIFSQTTRLKRRNLIIACCFLLLTFTYNATFKNPFIEGSETINRFVTYGILQVVVLYFLVMFVFRVFNELSTWRYITLATNVNKFHDHLLGAKNSMDNINYSIRNLSAQLQTFELNESRGKLTDSGKVLLKNVEGHIKTGLIEIKNKDWYGRHIFNEANKIKRKQKVQNFSTLFNLYVLEITLPVSLALFTLYKTEATKHAVNVCKAIWGV